MQPLYKILCVDDEPNILDSFRRQLRGKFELEVANSGVKALDLIRSGAQFSVVVSDMRMPAMDGVEFLRNVQKIAPATVRVMLTGNADQDTASKAINEGQIFRFINKPCSSETLEKVLQSATQQYRLQCAEKDLLQNTLSGSIKVLSEILSLSDPIAFGSASALREPVKALSKTLRIANAWELDLAAMLHPIGWVTVPESVKAKYRTNLALSNEEIQMIEGVPEQGFHFINSIPRLEGVARIILYSEKNIDGSGFPKDAIKQNQIPEGAKIIRIAKQLLKLESQGLAHTQALEILKNEPNKFDAEIISKLLSQENHSVQPPPEVASFAIQPNQLCPGQRLTENLFCLDGRLLLGSGTYLSELMCKSIHNYVESGTLKLPIMVDSRTPLLSKVEKR